MFQNVRLSRGVLPLLVCAALVAGCEKHDTPPADAARQSADALRQAAQDAAQRATQQATQKLDQAASFVNQQVDEARAWAAELASAAKGQWRDAASSANALLGHAAATTGTGLQAAGRALQQWASGTAAASAPAASGNGE